MTSGKQKKKRAVRTLLPLFIFMVLFELIILFIHKYNYHNLSISEFSVFYPGNLINIFITLSLIGGLLLLRYLRTEIYSEKLQLNSVFLILSFLFLAASILIVQIDVPFPAVYVFRQPLERVIESFVFMLFLLIQLIWLNMIWLAVIKVTNLLFLRSVINTILLLCLLLAASYIYADAGSQNLSSEPTLKNPADVGVVLGAAVWKKNEPSRILKVRLNKAAELYRKGLIRKIQLTGSNAPGEISEAEAAYRYLKRYNINKNDIMIETETTSTVEQIAFVKQKLIGESNYSSILIISDLFHLQRISEISRFYGITIRFAGTDVSDEKNIFYNKVREAIGILVFWFFAL